MKTAFTRKMSIVNDYSYMYALDSFAYQISNDYDLDKEYSDLNVWEDLSPCINNLFSEYEVFVETQKTGFDISWYKISDGDTVALDEAYNQSAIAIDQPVHTSTYIQSVITDHYAEIDQTTIYVDTIVNVVFAAQFQFDSTVVFESFVDPNVAGNKFYWNFGDGSSETTDINPIHEFAKFDTTFLVCLTVTNSCGEVEYCDSVYIDSLHWGGSSFVKNNKDISFQEKNEGKAIIEALFYPNPTQHSGILSYHFNGGESSGELIIIDNQGRILFEKELKKQEDNVVIPMENLASGLYFYQIFSLEGNVIRGKIYKY